MIPAPKPDELVECLFLDVLLPPEGYEYLPDPDGQLLFPVFGDDRWRILLKKKSDNSMIPVFLDGPFIFKLTKALHAMQREMNEACSDDIPEPVSRTPQ